MIEAAPDPVAARAVVDRAEATLGENDTCSFCSVMLAVPAAIACADVGDVGAARRHLAEAELSVARWELGAWQAAALEARAHVARAEDRPVEYQSLLLEAAQQFTLAGHARDAARCSRKAAELSGAARM